MILKTKEERAALLEGGKRLGEILANLSEESCAWITAEELDDLAEQLIREGGDNPHSSAIRPRSSPRVPGLALRLYQ